MKYKNLYPNELSGASSLDSFGMLMRERTYSSASYRFGFNGKENDAECETQDFGMRIYSSAICKFLSLDPLSGNFPWQSAYIYAGNSPIVAIDALGCGPQKPKPIFPSIAEIYAEAKTQTQLNTSNSGVNAAQLMILMFHESKLNPYLVGGTPDYGLGQITSVWFGVEIYNHEMITKDKLMDWAFNIKATLYIWEKDFAIVNKDKNTYKNDPDKIKAVYGVYNGGAHWNSKKSQRKKSVQKHINDLVRDIPTLIVKIDEEIKRNNEVITSANSQIEKYQKEIDAAMESKDINKALEATLMRNHYLDSKSKAENDNKLLEELKSSVKVIITPKKA